MTVVLPMQCFACVHARFTTTPTGGRLPTSCAAFPDGIPETMTGGGDHREPLPGDRGVRFEQADGQPAEEAFAAWQRFADQLARS